MMASTVLQVSYAIRVVTADGGLHRFTARYLTRGASERLPLGHMQGYRTSSRPCLVSGYGSDDEERCFSGAWSACRDQHQCCYAPRSVPAHAALSERSNAISA